MIDWETCELCKIVGPAVEIQMFVAPWAKPEEHGGRRFTSIVRCLNSQACRDRYEKPGSGKRWPLLDRTVATLPSTVKVVSEPLHPALPAPADAPVDEPPDMSDDEIKRLVG